MGGPRDRGGSPTEVLRADHQLILRVIETLGGIVDAMGQGGEAPLERIRKITRFSVNFVDRCHHAKEERCLFPCLEERGVPRESGPIGVMLAEHEEGRRLVREITEVIDSCSESDHDLLAGLCDEYAGLLTQHIFKENNILFAMADEVMTPEDQRSVLEGYAGVDTGQMAGGEADSLRRLGEEIAGG
jgi:hemerythrin-like domain-containing protein